MKEKWLPLSRKILIYATCVAFLFQGGYTAAYLLHKNTSKLDYWSGLSFSNVMATDCVRDCVDFMRQNGYTHGMIDYWYANVMMEMSDGTLTIAPYLPPTEHRPLQLYEWGTSRIAFLPEKLPEKMIIFMDEAEVARFQSFYPQSKKVHTGVFFSGVEVESSWIFPVDGEK